MDAPAISRRAALLGCGALLAGCAPRLLSYDGPAVTGVVLRKSARRLYLLNGSEPLESYGFQLGFAPIGHKRVEGDGRTPEGRYFIDRKNPNSAYHLSVGISYPNEDDRARAHAMGHSPGGDIFIHGTPRSFRGKDDWTWGCIAVSNREIEEIYSMVRIGTPIWLYP